MASLLPGYEYDIFISYRQKDNKYDGWVTDFVDNLQRELEATFKEEISVYFDINPHDGLLETHDVDASLKEKLKCLVFIPIISRTYCDPRSFAWGHEFKVFIEQALRDRLGLKVKLPNGNVGSRVLPIRIYDLDAADIKLCESVLGGVIRGVDFVYKEPGVNRPLTVDDDEKKNVNNTKYRNQINKTANAIKEIISGLTSGSETITGEKARQLETREERKPGAEQKAKVIAGSFYKKSVKWLVILLLIVLCIFGANAIYKKIKPGETRKTIAVYFTTDIKNDNELRRIRDTYTEALHTKLGSVKNLVLISRSALFPYRDSDKSLDEIRKLTGTKYFLYGNIRRDGKEIIINIELTSEKTKKQLWFKSYFFGEKTVSEISTEVVQAVVSRLYTKLSPVEKKLIETEPSANVEANQAYTLANSLSFNAQYSLLMADNYINSTSFRSAIEEYDKAILEDSSFAEAYAKRAAARAWAYYTGQVDSTHIEKCLEDINMAISLNKELPDIQMALGFYYYYCKKELDKAIEYFSIATASDPENYQPLFLLAMVYRRKAEWRKSMDLTKQLINLDPQDALCLTNIGMTFSYTHNYDSALLFHQKAIDVMPAWPYAYKNMIQTLVLKYGNTSEARSCLDKAIKNTGENFVEYKILLDIYDRKYADALQKAQESIPDDYPYPGDMQLYLAEIHSLMNNPRNASIYYDSAFKIISRKLTDDPDNPVLYSHLGIAFAGKGDREKAITTGIKAIDMYEFDNFDKSDMIINLAVIYTMVREFEQASTWVGVLLYRIPSELSDKLLELNPIWESLIKWPEFNIYLEKAQKTKINRQA